MIDLQLPESDCAAMAADGTDPCCDADAGCSLLGNAQDTLIAGEGAVSDSVAAGC